jgi:hypothetical protein
MAGACGALVGDLPLWRTLFGMPEISGLRGLPFPFGLAFRDLLSWPRRCATTSTCAACSIP